MKVKVPCPTITLAALRKASNRALEAMTNLPYAHRAASSPAQALLYQMLLNELRGVLGTAETHKNHLSKVEAANMTLPQLRERLDGIVTNVLAQGKRMGIDESVNEGVFKGIIDGIYENAARVMQSGAAARVVTSSGTHPGR